MVVDSFIYSLIKYTHMHTTHIYLSIHTHMIHIYISTIITCSASAMRLKTDQ